MTAARALFGPVARLAASALYAVAWRLRKLGRPTGVCESCWLEGVKRCDCHLPQHACTPWDDPQRRLAECQRCRDDAERQVTQ